MDKSEWPMRIQEYERLIGTEATDRIVEKAHRLHGLRVINISSTYYGGGVAEILSSLTLLQRSLGIHADWRLIQGSPDFFGVTKKLHNALQGAEINMTEIKRHIYEQMVMDNARRMDLDADFIVVHDMQPLPIITRYRRTCPWVWRCHVDLSRPNAEAWAYLRGFVEEYDAMIVSLPEYAQEISVPQIFFMPAIDPFCSKNSALAEPDIRDRLAHYGIPDDLPIVAQISRFDPWKDPEGVIEAFRIARREVPCTLVLLGNLASDDPEGQQVFESLLKCKEERVFILTATDSALVNALQRRARVVMQKSLREGFGLTVTEAMWKGAAVIGGNCGGIRRQIEDGVNGFLVSSVQEAAARMVQLLRDAGLREQLGARARETAGRHFLMSRLAEQYLDLFASFAPRFEMSHRRASALNLPTLSPGLKSN